MRPEIPHVPFAENETRIFIAGDTWPGPFPEETITLGRSINTPYKAIVSLG
jgi:hypothetical protein